MKIAVTGHRPDKLNHDYDGTSILSERIYDELVKIVLRNKEKHGEDLRLITGMALGVDTLFAWVSIDLKVKFTAAIPFPGQEKLWPDLSQKAYKDIINHPLCTIKYVSLGEYSAYKLQLRNEWMVNNCDGLIAVHNGTKGGTYNCLNYARSKNKKIIIINPLNLI